MKVLLAGINSKYIHTCLAVWYLKASILNTQGFVSANNSIDVREFTINDQKDNILSEIYKEKPDILAFSCYIWNIEIVLALSKELKKLLPSCQIVLGGPEVSYDSETILKDNSEIDFILSGEGEETLSALCASLVNSTDQYKQLNGIAFREDNQVVFNEGFNLVKDLDKLPSPYTKELMDSAENRIVYYESSRGCPFSCSYCISSTFNGVRFFSLDRVKKDLEVLLQYKPRLIKFVDRTFNCSKNRAKEIFKHLISLECQTLFHFEAAADLFDEEMLEILRKAKKGLIQLEIGIQTTNTEALNEIDRVTDLNRLFYNVKNIISMGNIHVHVDLIAGLPYEDLTSFQNSFNQVYSLGANQLQLGFLKLLKGSKIRNDATKHGFVYKNYSPYEVLSNNYISYEDILLLKDIEEVLERFFNSGRFSKTLELILNNIFENPFNMFYRLSCYLRDNGYLDRPISYKENILVLYEFFKQLNQEQITLELFRQCMVFDFLSSDNSCAIPGFLKIEGDLLQADTIHNLLKNNNFLSEYLPSFIGIQAKNILKKVFFIKLNLIAPDDEFFMFDYSQKDLISDKYRSVIISED